MAAKHSASPTSYRAFFHGLGRFEPAYRCHANGRNRVRRETGKELMVQVHYGEGVAVRQAKLARSSR
jgi:hypothetical protein